MPRSTTTGCHLLPVPGRFRYPYSGRSDPAAEGAGHRTYRYGSARASTSRRWRTTSEPKVSMSGWQTNQQDPAGAGAQVAASPRPTDTGTGRSSLSVQASSTRTESHSAQSPGHRTRSPCGDSTGSERRQSHAPAIRGYRTREGCKEHRNPRQHQSGPAGIGAGPETASLSPGAVIVPLQEITPDDLLDLGFGCYVNTACPRLAYDDRFRFPAHGPLPAGVRDPLRCTGLGRL